MDLSNCTQSDINQLYNNSNSNTTVINDTNVTNTTNNDNININNHNQMYNLIQNKNNHMNNYNNHIHNMNMQQPNINANISVKKNNVNELTHLKHDIKDVFTYLRDNVSKLEKGDDINDISIIEENICKFAMAYVDTIKKHIEKNKNWFDADFNNQRITFKNNMNTYNEFTNNYVKNDCIRFV